VTLGTHSPVFAHRYLADGFIEVICMNCLDVICNARTEEAAAPFLKTHTCESAELERWTQVTHPSVALNKWSPRKWWGIVVTLVSKSNRTPRIVVRPEEYMR